MSAADDDEVLQITRDFRASLPGRVQAMQDALAVIHAGSATSDDAKIHLRTLAHKLRGSCGSFGLSELAAPSRVIEEACKSGNWGAIGPAIEELARVVSGLR